MRLRAAAAVVLTLGLLAACGDDGGSSSTDGSTTPAAAAEVTGAGAQLSAAQTEAALLTVQDMPTGWSSAPYDDEDSDDTKLEPAKCNDLLEELGDDEGDDTELHEAGATFTRGGELGTELTMEVTTHSDVFEADTLDPKFAAVLETCGEMTTLVEGEQVKASLTEMSFPQVGEKTYALRMEISAGGLTMVSDQIMVGVGHNAITFSSIGFEVLPPAELEKIVRAGMAGVEKAATGAAA